MFLLLSVVVVRIQAVLRFVLRLLTSQAKVLEPLGAITSGSQFLEPDGMSISWPTSYL